MKKKAKHNLTSAKEFVRIIQESVTAKSLPEDCKSIWEFPDHLPQLSYNSEYYIKDVNWIFDNHLELIQEFDDMFCPHQDETIENLLVNQCLEAQETVSNQKGR